MDIQRTLLIGAIALLSFMLLSEWVAFRDAREADAAPATQRLTAGSVPASAQVPAASGDTDAAGEPATGELPADLPPPPDDTPETAAAEAGDARIVQVFTDTLELAIDLNGGDIVEVALPKYLAELDGDDPYVLLERNSRRTYVAQSGLVGPDGIDAPRRARYDAAQTRYELAPGQDTLTIDLAWTGNNGLKITKRFTLRRGEYVLDVTYLVENNTEARWQANLFGQIKRDSSPDPSADAGLGLQPFLGAATTQPDDRFTKFDFKDMREDPFKRQLEGSWMAMVQHYFLSAWIPNPQQTNTDGDALGDECDDDLDGDTIPNVTDNCVFIPNMDQSDVDGDMLGDVCDDDADNDGVPNTMDNCELVANPTQADADMDGIGDDCDDDNDNDTIANDADNKRGHIRAELMVTI